MDWLSNLTGDIVIAGRNFGGGSSSVKICRNFSSSSSGGFSFLLTQKQEAYKTLTKEQQRFWKRILIVDDDPDITTTFKAAIEDNNNGNDANNIEVYTANDPVVALSEFKPNFFDLLLVDINMPYMNGFELYEKILVIDINVRICFMSSLEINREGLREIHH